MPGITVSWTRPAQLQLQALYYHISKDSPVNADKVLHDIIESVERATLNPLMYPPDKLKIANDGSFRVFEKHHFRISFRFINNEIRVLRVRHTSMLPKKF